MKFLFKILDTDAILEHVILSTPHFIIVSFNVMSYPLVTKRNYRLN